MASTISPQLTTDDDNNQQRQSQLRGSDIPTNFVLGRPHTGPGRVNNSEQYTTGVNGGNRISYIPVSDAEHNLSLLDHLSADLANLLNRTDISDCFLNVQGTFMAVHKCILAARSNAFAGKKDFFIVHRYSLYYTVFSSCYFG